MRFNATFIHILRLYVYSKHQYWRTSFDLYSIASFSQQHTVIFYVQCHLHQISDINWFNYHVLYLHIKHLTSLDCNYSWKLLSLGHSGPAGERFLDIFLFPESQLLEFAGGLFFDKYLVYIIYFSLKHISLFFLLPLFWKSQQLAVGYSSLFVHVSHVIPQTRLTGLGRHLEKWCISTSHVEICKKKKSLWP